jgi:hypothetical protein
MYKIKCSPLNPPKGDLAVCENLKHLQSFEVWLLSFEEAAVRFYLMVNKEVAMLDFSGDAPFIFKSLLNFYYAIDSPLNPPKGDWQSVKI